ncbi:MAG: uroporphyrinogen decarboxylase family protein [Kiritimatiellae bacterium]|nr:uroporphyrinogen decarboxylase family protein [Kiritimatiellia bacterium]
MTSRERVLTAFRRQEPDRVPAVLYDELIGYVPDVAKMLKEKCGSKSPLEYFGFDITSFSLAPSRQKYDFSRYVSADEHTTIDEWGVGWKRGTQMHYAEILHPMQNLTADEIRAYPFPDLDEKYRYDGVREKISEIHAKGLATAFFPGSIFETAWYMRNMEQLFADIMTEPEISEYLLDRITDIVTGATVHLAKADLDLLILGDDIAMQTGMMMSMEMWRKTFKPRLMKVIKAAKEVKPDILVFYHSDGKVWDAIPDLIDAGVDVLNPVQPECMDPAEVKRAFGDRLSFFGTISVQKTMPFGTPDDVRAEVKLRMETIGKYGGLLLAPSHVLQPDTPWKNIVAFFEAVEEFGYYK